MTAVRPDGPVREDGPAPEAGAAQPWLRLNPKLIWVDALRVLLSLLPAAFALLVLDVESNAGVVGSVGAIALMGVAGAVADLVRWVRTRYRVTEEYVERRTGLFVRRHRSIRRDRIRSVDAEARLLHRITGLRRVRIGAGQVVTAGEPALVLDAVDRKVAEELRRQLLGVRPRAGAARAEEVRPAEEAGPSARAPQPGDATPDGGRVLAVLRWWWVVYNIVGVWVCVAAAGVLWGAFWTTSLFGFDAAAWIGSLADWEALGPVRTTAVALAATGALGVLWMAGSFFTEHARFRLERLPAGDGTVLRTTQGLFKTREITRDDSRLRGVSISEPLLWRWSGMADTSVITTGLSVWSTASTVLPRGPRRVAYPVAAEILGAPRNPLAAPLLRHPRAALHRRLLWAVSATAAATVLIAWLGATTGFGGRAWWIAAAVLLPAAAGLAVAAHRSLGDAVAGDYLVVRAGAMTRTTSALRRDAVCGVRVRQSVLQRRLGLATFSASTAAGYGRYSAPDAGVRRVEELAAAVLPEHVRPLLEGDRADHGPDRKGPVGA